MFAKFGAVYLPILHKHINTRSPGCLHVASTKRPRPDDNFQLLRPTYVNSTPELGHSSQPSHKLKRALPLQRVSTSFASAHHSRRRFLRDMPGSRSNSRDIISLNASNAEQRCWGSQASTSGNAGRCALQVIMS